MTIELESPTDPFLERVPPQDHYAEISILAACMQSAAACKVALETVDPVAFYEPRHTLIFNGIGRMRAVGQAIDPITLGKHLADTGDITHIGGAGYLHEILRLCPYAGNPLEYAEIIQDRALRRSVIQFGTGLVEAGYGTATATADLVERAVTMTRELRDQGMAAEELPTEDIIDFVQHQDTYDWLVPGLLERGDRLIITAAEGGGKSTLLRQMAVTLAAGIHPFNTTDYTDPLRVLVLDCENGAPASRRKYRPLLDAAAHSEQPLRRGQFSIECRPQGLDLTQARDRAWTMRRIEKLRPEVLIIGPVYRLHAGNPNDEELARKVSVVIDEARATVNCAVLMEAHAPHHNGFGTHRALRPLGSSLWMRWPEFGYGLRPVDDEISASQERARVVVPWRGARDEREWPTHVKQGMRWPWIPYTPPPAMPGGKS